MKKILLVFALLTMLVACGPVQTSEQPMVQHPEGPEKGYAEILVDYHIRYNDTRVWVEKIGIDGHEYLMFGSGLANPPTVIHAETCPCKQTTKQ